MKKGLLLSKLILATWITSMMSLVHGQTPLWSFTPKTSTGITVPVNSTATVIYEVTNQSEKTHRLVLQPIPGISQVSTPGNCPNPFVLIGHESCILNLTIDGAALKRPINEGPVVCEQGSPNQCYQPSEANSLHISQGTSVYYTVGGSVFGLIGTLVLVNNGDNALTLNTDGTFSFSETEDHGSSYLVTVQSQPATQTCTVTNGSGTITNANVNNIIVHCSTNIRTLGGNVSGLDPLESLVLQNNGGDNLFITSDGPYTFPTGVPQGGNYNVTVLTQPATQTCTVNNGHGTAGLSNITNVQVTCSENAYTVGGTISGLSGTVVLQNDGANNLTLNSNGEFTFSTPVAEGAAYNVTVLTQPVGQTCTATNGSGTMGGSNITNININCTINTTTLTVNVSQLALSVTGLTEYGVSGTPSSGLARVVSITNTGSATAVDISVTLPTWPSGTTSSSTCGSTLGVGNNCTITITPGNTATSDGTNPCSMGTAPVAGIIQVSASNANTVSSSVVVLSYACIYQGGYVYAFDDTSPNTGSVRGKVASLVDQAVPFPNGIIWSSNGTSGNIAYDPIYGISSISTILAPDPNVSGPSPGQIACNGATDGACDTNNIYVYYQNTATNHPINPLFYAAGLCKQTIATYSDWYLSAICEMGYGGVVPCGSSGVPTLQNMQSSLVDFNNINLLSGYYWSATEYPLVSNPYTFAWYQQFAPAAGSTQGADNKNVRYGVRCSRSLTP